MKRFPAHIFITDKDYLPLNPHSEEAKLLCKKVGGKFVSKVKEAILDRGYLETYPQDIIQLLKGFDLPVMNDYTEISLSNKTWEKIERKMTQISYT